MGIEIRIGPSLAVMGHTLPVWPACQANRAEHNDCID
jgi:hypothetical protein